jgi:hypothetical protein
MMVEGRSSHPGEANEGRWQRASDGLKAGFLKSFLGDGVGTGGTASDNAYSGAKSGRYDAVSKHAFISGGTQGSGVEIARAMAARGG